MQIYFYALCLQQPSVTQGCGCQREEGGGGWWWSGRGEVGVGGSEWGEGVAGVIVVMLTRLTVRSVGRKENTPGLDGSRSSGAAVGVFATGAAEESEAGAKNPNGERFSLFLVHLRKSTGFWCSFC